VSLDLFSQNVEEAVSYASRTSAPELPSTFTDNFHDAWNRGILTSQSISGQTRNASARGELVDEAVAATGDKSLANLFIRQPYGDEVVFDDNAFNERIAEHRKARPDLNLPTLSDEAIQARADDIGRRQLADSASLAGRERTFGGTVGQFAGAAAGSLTDPVNLVAFPLAAPESLGVLGTALAWGAIGAGSQGIIEALNSSAMERIQPGYSASGAPFASIVEAAGGAAVLGGTLKGLAAAWTKAKTGEWPRSIRDAGNVVESEAQIASTNRFPGAEGEAFHRTALQQAIDDMAAGRPAFDQRPLPEGGILAAYDAKLTPIMDARARAAGADESAIAFERDAVRLPPTMERLSEVQLSEFRDVAVQARQDAAAARNAISGERAAVTSDRAGLTQRAADLEAPRQEVAGLQADIARLDQRLAEARPVTDAETQARIAAIDADLKGQVGQDARARLEAERAQITETLAKTGPEDERLLASLNAERKALAKALDRSEKKLAKAEAQIAKHSERVNAREQAIPRREQTVGEREAAKVDAATNSLRRSVARLAQDGYGVRLPAEDAQAFAARILGANDNEIEAALRGVTEDLVSRAVDLRRLQPPELPGIGKSVPAAEQRARAQYYTEEMRKGITAIAREVGYEMPREEAAAIAARLSGMSEHDAMAVLDELLLRPRTLLETLPGTGAARAPASAEGVSRLEPNTAAALRAELTPANIEEARVHPDMEETVSRDLDKLMLEKPDLEVPTGVTVDADGRTVAATRKVEDVVAEADSRLAAAKEIADCVGPYPAEAAQ
jgi:hypothetical protein